MHAGTYTLLEFDRPYTHTECLTETTRIKQDVSWSLPLPLLARLCDQVDSVC